MTVPTGLTPVVYKNNNWIIVDSSYSKWYDYEKQEWANAVILNDNVLNKAGTILNILTDVKAMFVYVPRYEYKINGDWGIHSNGAMGTKSLPGEIEVKFIPNSQIEASLGDYIIHPAFDFGGKQLEGIWVGKFELSHNDSKKSTTSLGCIDEKCSNADNLRILPNVSSLRNNNVSNFFYGIRSMERDGNGFGFEGNSVDIHMMKNSEWGAVAYLSQSMYGKYGNSNYIDSAKEIFQNKSTTYITGNSNGTPSTSATSSLQCVYDNTINNCGIGASTTGNITGIYDMSGGAREYVMGYLTTASTIWGATSEDNYAGFINEPNKKYYESYIEYAKNDKGHALGEISVSSKGQNSWYFDYSIFVLPESPWLVRGGNYHRGIDAGIFNFNCYLGDASNAYSTRVVLVQD